MDLNVHIMPKEEGCYLITLNGQLDSKTSESFEQKLASVLSPATKVLIFDMSNLSYISSMGIRIIFKAEKALEMNDGKVFMVNVQPHIEKIFKIAVVFTKYQNFKTVEEASAFWSETLRKESNPPKAE
jgi:anti-sigma B factor antagonist